MFGSIYFLYLELDMYFVELAFVMFGSIYFLYLELNMYFVYRHMLCVFVFGF